MTGLPGRLESGRVLEPMVTCWKIITSFPSVAPLEMNTPRQPWGK